VHFLRLEEGEK